MKKSEVQMHNDRPYGHQYPAVCVKVHCWIGVDKIVKRFKCSEAQAQRASEYAYNSSVQQFWDGATEVAQEVLRTSQVKVYSTGRSSGWLIVTGLSDVESWDAIMLGKWAKFVKTIKSDIEYRCKPETVYDDIDANAWYKEGAEEYNFVDTKECTKCIADMKAEAVVAGFGPVVRAPVPA